jgi:hypothetical protein
MNTLKRISKRSSDAHHISGPLKFSQATNILSVGAYIAIVRRESVLKVDGLFRTNSVLKKAGGMHKCDCELLEI